MNKDRSIQIKLSLGYLLLISAAVFAIWYILNLTKELDKPQEMILLENNKVFQIGSLISDFYVSESTSRVALLTLDAKDINRYNQKMDSLTQQTFSVKNIVDGTEIENKLDSIVLLLGLKREAFKELIETRKKYRQYTSINEALEKINNTKSSYTDENSITVDEPEENSKNGFFKRITNAFTSKNEIELEKAKLKQKEILEKTKQEGQENLESFRKKADHILSDALKKENKKLEQYLKKEEQLVQRNINFSTKIRDLVFSLEKVATYNSQNIFSETNKKIEIVTKNLFLFGGVTLLVILILALILIDDINKNHKYKKNLERSNRNLEEIMRQKNFFMASITHDMNAPLNTLFGFTELLENSLRDDKLKNYAHNIHYSASYFKGLVDDLSLFSKLEHNFVELHIQSFNLKELLNKVYQQQLTITNKKNIELKLFIDKNIKENYLGDAQKIAQILTNVISNAIKFTNQGYVSIEAHQLSSGVTIKVIDTGIGIEVNDKNDLYKEFVQAHKEIEKTYGGTGLGLNITKRLIQLMNGTIDFESALGHGTTFQINLPLRVSEKEITLVNEETILIDPNKKLSNKNILVIDDDILQLQLLKEILSDKVNSIDLLSDGRQLSKYLNEKQYHLIISDLQMPKLTGYQIIKEIRNNAAYLNVPVIAFSGKIDLNESHLKEIGFNAILRKPINLKKLLITINQQLQIQYNIDQPIVKQSKNKKNESKDYSLVDLEEMFDGDREAITNILSIFLENVHIDLQNMFDSYKKGDLETVSRLAHKLLPMYRQLHITSQIKKLEILEHDIHNVNEQELVKMLIKFFTVSDKILKDIKKIELS